MSLSQPAAVRARAYALSEATSLVEPIAAPGNLGARVRCLQCYLPVRGAGVRLRLDGAVRTFCCYGCYLVLRITREQGAGGQAQGIFLRLGVALFFSMNAMMFTLPTYFPYVYGADQEAAGFLLWLRLGALLFTLPVLLLLGLPVAWQALRDARSWIVSTDALIALATLAAFGVSVANTCNGAPHVYFDTVAMLLIFVALGRYLEAQAKAETAGVLRRINEAQAAPVRIERGGAVVEVAMPQVRLGDVVCLRPGDLCPVDGTVVGGQAHFDQASLTGESLPQLKTIGDDVISGTANLDGEVRVRTLRLGENSTLGHLQRLVEETLAQRCGLQRIADRLATLFMPVVLGLAAGTFLYWSIYDGPEAALLTFLSVLVVACPCAFGIATPAALWIGIGEAARRGALLKSVDVLETLARVDTVWFDKTGTLTGGRMRFERLQRAPQVPASEAELLAVARGLEAGIPHPIAEALAGGAAARVEDLRYEAGLGIEGRIGDQQWFLGSAEFLRRRQARLEAWVDELLEAPGAATAVLVLLARRTSADAAIEVCALLRFGDRLRDEARKVVEQVEALGVRVGVLSGGANGLLVTPIGRLTAHLGLLPGQKVEWITRSRAGGAVLMVGDGLNDAPALAAADVGIALGSGRELIREAASISVLSGDLNIVPWLLRWSRRVRRTIMQNLSWAVAYNGVAIAAAMGAWLNPVIAALAMIASSVVIIANARRLRAFA